VDTAKFGEDIKGRIYGLLFSCIQTDNLSLVFRCLARGHQDVLRVLRSSSADYPVTFSGRRPLTYTITFILRVWKV
jgi:hypothetical protein